MKLGLKRDEVLLEPYCEEWKMEFLHVKDDILQSTSIEENRIKHIGSTAIKGMMSKPILDIAVGVDDLNHVEDAIFEGLKSVGFLRLRVERENEIVLAKFTDKTYEVKTHYIHLVQFEGELWKNLLFFRDYLNSNTNDREYYQNLKLEFVQSKSGDITAYTDHKEQFVKEIYDRRT